MHATVVYNSLRHPLITDTGGVDFFKVIRRLVSSFHVKNTDVSLKGATEHEIIVFRAE